MKPAWFKVEYGGLTEWEDKDVCLLYDKMFDRIDTLTGFNRLPKDLDGDYTHYMIVRPPEET